MSTNTEYLGLLKKDPVLDAADTFNLQEMLNDNWDKIDEAARGLKEDAPFIAIYDVTAYEELEEAYSAGKAMAISVDGMQIPFCKLDGSSYSFQINRYGTFYSYWCSPFSGWGSKTVALPLKHANRHKNGGDDPIAPADIGAAVTMDLEVQVSLDSWSANGDKGIYTKWLGTGVVKKTDKIIVDVVTSATEADVNAKYLDSFSKLVRVTTPADGNIQLFSTGKPDYAYKINVKVVR